MRDLWSKFLGYQKKTENQGQEMNWFQPLRSFTQRKVLRPVVPPLLWIEAWSSWSQTYFYGRTIKLWENFPWEVTGFSTSCHSWEVSYASACWKTCSEQTQIAGPTCGTREQASLSHGHTDTTNVLFSKPTSEKWTETYCLCVDATVSSHGGDSNVVAKSNLSLCSPCFGGNCRCLSTVAKESNVLIWPPNKSQENFSEAQDLNKHPIPSCIYGLTSTQGKACYISFVSFLLNKSNPHTQGIYLSSRRKDFCSGWGNGREKSKMTCLFSRRTVISFCQQQKQKIFVSIHVYKATASNQAAWVPIFRDGTQGCLL